MPAYNLRFQGVSGSSRRYYFQIRTCVYGLSVRLSDAFIEVLLLVLSDIVRYCSTVTFTSTILCCPRFKRYYIINCFIVNRRYLSRHAPIPWHFDVHCRSATLHLPLTRFAFSYTHTHRCAIIQLLDNLRAGRLSERNYCCLRHIINFHKCSVCKSRTDYGCINFNGRSSVV